MLGNNIGVTLVLLGDARDYATKHINPEVEVVHGEDVAVAVKDDAGAAEKDPPPLGARGTV